MLNHLYSVALLSDLAPLAAFLLIPHYYAKANKPILALALLIVALETLTLGLMYFRGNNMIVTYLLTPTEYFFLLAALNHLMVAKFNKLWWAAGAIIAVMTIVDYILIGKGIYFNSFSRTLSSFLLIIASIVSLFDILNNPPDIYIHRTPLFWLAIAVLSYMAGNLFLFAINQVNQIKAILPKDIWLLHTFLQIAFNLLLEKSILCLKKAR
jgi:ABC-type multidrug transport system fused ATPase/permease subunit